MTIRIKYDEAIEFLQRAVADKGVQYIYDPRIENPDDLGCSYFTDGGAPSCIVGHVFSYLGLTKNDIGEENNDATVILLGKRGVLDLDAKTETLLDHAQSRQDLGYPWGEAVEEAIIRTGGGNR